MSEMLARTAHSRSDTGCEAWPALVKSGGVAGLNPEAIRSVLDSVPDTCMIAVAQGFCQQLIPRLASAKPVPRATRAIEWHQIL